MKTAARIKPHPKTDDGRRLLLHSVTWAGYEKFLDAVGNNAIRVNYDRGTLEIVVPLFEHEAWKHAIDRLIMALGIELGLAFRGAGSTTLRRQSVGRGLEPDECYYIQNFESVRTLRELDLNVTPPPDLALEIDWKSSSVSRMGIYAALGVPEVWRFDGVAMTMCKLSDGVYVTVSESVAIPGLTLERVADFLAVAMTLPNERDLFLFACEWVKEHVLPLWKARPKSPEAKPRRKRPPTK